MPLYIGLSLDTCNVGTWRTYTYWGTTPKCSVHVLRNQIPWQRLLRFSQKPNVSHPMVDIYGAYGDFWALNFWMGGLIEKSFHSCHPDTCRHLPANLQRNRKDNKMTYSCQCSSGAPINSKLSCSWLITNHKPHKDLNNTKYHHCCSIKIHMEVKPPFNRLIHFAWPLRSHLRMSREGLPRPWGGAPTDEPGSDRLAPEESHLWMSRKGLPRPWRESTTNELGGIVPPMRRVTYRWAGKWFPATRSHLWMSQEGLPGPRGESPTDDFFASDDSNDEWRAAQFSSHFSAVRLVSPWRQFGTPR